jgi:hypothetical protein
MKRKRKLKREEEMVLWEKKEGWDGREENIERW